MTIGELKKFIYDNEKIEYILCEIGCTNVKYNSNKDYFYATQPDGDNPMGVVINNSEYLNYRSYSRGVNYEDNQDLINLVENIKKMSFIEAVKYLHNLLDLPFELTRKEAPKKKNDPLDVFKRVLRCNRRVVNAEDIQALSDELLDDYTPLLHIDWVKNDGITERTRKKFQIAYSYRKKRIIIPHYYWMTSELIGVNARTTIENFEEFGIPKYLLTTGLDKSLNIYGYCQNKDEIEKKGYCILYESEKSVLKRDSRLDSTGLALSGKFVSDEQVRIILSLNINEVVISMDNDVDEEEIWHICEKFYRYRKVSYIKDKYSILGDKDSPADASMKDFQFLFDNRIVYDEEIHKQYLKSLEKK